MSTSYDKVLSTSTRAWKFQRLELVIEFLQRGSFPHPASVIADVVWILVAIFTHVCCCSTSIRPSSLAQARAEIARAQAAGEGGADQSPAAGRAEAAMVQQADWEKFYASDECMATLHHDVFQEPDLGVPALSFEPQHEKERQAPSAMSPMSSLSSWPSSSWMSPAAAARLLRAQYMRKCADLAIRTTVKRNAAQLRGGGGEPASA